MRLILRSLADMDSSSALENEVELVVLSWLLENPSLDWLAAPFLIKGVIDRLDKLCRVFSIDRRGSSL
jgi:hypothetical protein